MTGSQNADIKEVVEFINSSFPIDWNAEAAHIAETAPLDPSPCFVVVYYPACDCGESVLLRLQNMAEPPLVIVGTEYMETCYECAAVSSD